MRRWSLPADSPFSLRLAADARLAPTDYADDQIWELGLKGGDPPAVALQTTYGLRARSMRLFPAFGADGQVVTDPSRFVEGPRVGLFLPNYASLAFAPLAGIAVQGEYWVPESHAVAGRFTLTNQRAQPVEAQLTLHAVLRPGDGGQPMGPATAAGATVLSGATANLMPVVFLTGGATIGAAPYPDLTVSLSLAPGASKSVTWAQAALRELQPSFELARATAGRAWDAEVARLEVANTSLIEVETGNADWDVALLAAQKVALGAFVGPTRHLPQTSFVCARLPDRGYSEREDGRDHGAQWDGQEAVHAYTLLPLVVHAAPELATGVIRNFLSVQSADGSIDGKPGLAGQRSGALSVPLLATLAWQVYEHTEDRRFLEEVLPGLLEFVQVWFTPEHDRDEDGHPEWDHTVQSGFADSPCFVRWTRWGQALDITKAETVDLASYLHRECQALAAIAGALRRPDLLPGLQARASRLRHSVERTWSDSACCYHHQDRDTHCSVAGETLGRGRGAFTLEVGRAFMPAARLLFRCTGPEGQSHSVQVEIHGRGRRGRLRAEHLTEHEFQWFWEQGSATTERAYLEVDRLQVSGLSEAFETEVAVADFARQDASLLLPLWAGIPDADRGERLVRHALLDPSRFWRPGGIPDCAASDPAYRPGTREGCGGVWMMWNAMLGEGLIDYGHADEAADLFRRLMEDVVTSLRADNSFREAYHPDTHEGTGERDHIRGLAPLRLFLRLCGVRLINPHKLEISGRCVFSGPVVLHWRGLEVRRKGWHARITFPDGQAVEVDGEEPRMIEELR